MAITKLLRIKETAGRNPAAHLKKNLFYICDPEKTENGIFIGGNTGSSPQEIYDRMIRNKKNWEKETGTQAFHYILSLPPDCDISPEVMMQVTEDFCRTLLGDDYYYVIAVHTDKGHLHSHITFDSVARSDGRKFHSPKGDWKKRIQPITDKLCEKYHLPMLDYDPENPIGIGHKDWEKKKKIEDGSNSNEYTWSDIIRDDIDEAISMAGSYMDFLNILRDQKYTIRDGKYLSLKPYGKDKAVRSYRLGKGYGKEDIQRRIEEKALEDYYKPFIRTYGDRKYIKTVLLMQIGRQKKFVLTPFQKQYYKKWQNTYFIRKPCFNNSWKYKKDIINVRKLAEQFSYIIDHRICSLDDIHRCRAEITERLIQTKLLLDTANTRKYKKEPMQRVYEYLMLEKKLAGFPPGEVPHIEEKLRSIKQEIEKICPIKQAVAEYEEVDRRTSFYKNEMRKMKNELKILDRIENTDLSTPEISQEWVKEQYNLKRQKEKAKVRPYGAATRVTINRKLFRGEFDESKNFFRSRIPYQDAIIEIPTEHCLLCSNGKICSVYLYDELTYTVIDKNEKRKVKGEQLKSNYENKPLKQHADTQSKQNATPIL